MDGQDWVDGYRARLATVGARVDAVARELAGITARGSSRDEIVSVEVDAAGGLRRVVFSGAAERLSVVELAAAVLEAGQRAQAQAEGAANGALAQLTVRSPPARPRPPDAIGGRR